jgi:TP901-1 family phage major tail protein
MSAQKGKDMLLKVDTDGGGTFISLAGLRARTLSFNTETVDITSSESAGQWRELLSCGVKTARLSGSGIFKDQQSDETLRGYFFNGTLRDWQLIIPDFGTLEGPFQISGFEYAGNHNGEITFELTLESAGAISFTAL